MNRRSFWIAMAVSAAAFLLGAYLWLPASTPPGQQPLMRLSAGNAEEFAAAYDAASAGKRLVLLLSPT